MKLLLSLLIASVSFPLFGAQYRNPNPTFTLTYNDQSWEVAPKGSQRPEKEDVDKKMAEQTLVNLQRKQEDEKYHARVSVVLDQKFKDQGAKQLEAYQKHAVEFLKSQRFDVQKVTTYQLPKVSEPTVEIQATQRDFGLTFRQVIFVHGGQVFLITGAARSKQADAQMPEIGAIIDSFICL